MSSLPLPFDVMRIPRVDAVGIEERAAALGKRSIKKSSKVAGIKLAISMLDLTTLEGKDSEGKVRQLCAKAIRPLPVLYAGLNEETRVRQRGPRMERRGN